MDRSHARPVCPNCGYVRYRNPAVGVSAVVRDEAGRVLVGRRSRGEHEGLWCIPCGYVEWDEDLRAAAIRELREETGIIVTIGPVIAVHSNFHNPRQHTVGVWFSSTVVGHTNDPTDGELSETAFIDPGDPPPMAFPTDSLVLAQLSAELRRGAPRREEPA
jgi:ADP-ribose pyrophosphatase YjhB (NUDIX family)